MQHVSSTGRALRAGAIVLLTLSLLTACLNPLTGGQSDARVPITREALAAIIVDVLDVKPKAYEPNPLWNEPGVIAATVDFGRQQNVTASVRDNADYGTEFCNHGNCDSWEIEGGTIRMFWQLGEPEEDPGYVAISYATDGETRTASYAGDWIDKDPRKLDLEVNVDDLVRLVTDDRFALSTTQEMVDINLPKWPKKEEHNGDAVPLTPMLLAAMTASRVWNTPEWSEAVDTSTFGPDALGARMVYEDGLVMTVLLVPSDAPELPTCPKTAQCTTGKNGNIVYGWQPGEAIGIRTFDEGTVYTSMEWKSIVSDPRADGGLDEWVSMTFYEAVENTRWGDPWSFITSRINAKEAEDLVHWRE